MTIIFYERNQMTIPDKLFPDVFRICCTLLDPNLLACVSVFERSLHLEKMMGKSPEKVMHVALLSLQILGSLRMRWNILEHATRFAPLIAKHWPKLFHGLEKIRNTLGTGGLNSKAGTSRAAILAGALVAVLSNGAVLTSLKADTELHKLAWKLWLDGGPVTFENNDVHYSAAATVISWIQRESNGKNALFANLMDVCKTFGGKDVIAKIALLSVC